MRATVAFLFLCFLFACISLADVPYWRNEVQLVGMEIEADPVGSLRRAANALGLELVEERVEEAAARLGNQDAKNPGRQFVRDRRQDQDDAVERIHQASLNRALDWVGALPSEL